MKDPYAILGVAPGASAEDLKSAYRRLARELHPDIDPGNPWAENEFKELAAAYDLLSDPGRRARFDAGGHAGPPKRPSRAKPKRPSPKRPKHEAKRDKTAGLKIKGANVEYSLRVDFMEAALGAKRHISMTTGKRLKVKIPPGTEDGRVLRLKGQGMAGIGGGADGDALVEILVDPHPVFRRDKSDIHIDAPVTLPEAVLGGKIEAPTVYGVVNVTVPRGSNTGTSLRLKGKGLPGAGKSNGAKGDEFVHLRVVLPKKPDKAFIRFLDEWAPGKAYKVRAKDWAKHPAGK